MKKNYLEPTEKVVELDLDCNLLQDSETEQIEETILPGEGNGDGLVKRESLWGDLW